MSSANTPRSAPRRWFVLIGIDSYMPGTDRRDEYGDIITFHSLRGCVYDVLNVKAFIEKKFIAEPHHIETLTSTAYCNWAEEPKEKLPTYDNIVRLLREITEQAKAGDLVHIHYSGHGARVRGIYKKKKALFKAIVPVDIACGGDYILDAELSELLDAMVSRKLIVTVVLDCCHSGGGSARNSSSELSNYRGIEQIDATAGAQLDVIDDDVQEWSTPTLSHQPSSARGFGGLGRLGTRNLKGYELLAACSVNEKAFERRYDCMWQGVLTYHLLKTLRTVDIITHGMLYRRIVALVNGSVEKQTPIFKGDSQRYLFSSNRFEGPLVSQFTIRRLHLHKDKQLYPILDVGAAHRMISGSELTIYPWNATDFSDSSCCPKIRVTEVWPLESMAKVIDPQTGDAPIEPGCQAIPSKPLVDELMVKSSEFPEGGKFMQLRAEISSQTAQSSFSWQTSGVKLVSGANNSADYHIKVENDQYKLLNTKNQLIDHFPSSIDPVLFLYNLRHLAKYEMFRTLENADVPQALKGKFNFTLEVVGESVILQGDSKFSVKDGTTVRFKFQNNSQMPLNVTILDFGPWWNIKKIFPSDMDFYTVEPGQCIADDEFEMYIPDNWDPSWSNPIDWFKVFITTLTTSFRSLELPKLSNSVATPDRHITSAVFDLEGLSDYVDTNVSGRDAKPSLKSRGKYWATAEIEVQTIPNWSNEDDSGEEFLDCEG